MSFGWVIDDDGADKTAAGGPGPFALSLAEREHDGEAHQSRCVPCQTLGEPFACVGLIDTPLPTLAERWLVDQLPEDIESLPGFLLRKAIGDYGYTGDFGKLLREKGLLEAPGPFTRHFGPFFRRFTVSSEQLLEELLGAGDVAPAHALACLAHLGAIAVDGKVLLTLDEGQLYGELIEHIDQRRARTLCPISPKDGDSPAILSWKRYLRALWAAFVLDAPVKIFGGPEGAAEDPKPQ